MKVKLLKPTLGHLPGAVIGISNSRAYHFMTTGLVKKDDEFMKKHEDTIKPVKKVVKKSKPIKKK